MCALAPDTSFEPQTLPVFDLLGNKIPILNAKNGTASSHVCDFTKSIRRLTVFLASVFLASVDTPEAQN